MCYLWAHPSFELINTQEEKARVRQKLMAEGVGLDPKSIAGGQSPELMKAVFRALARRCVVLQKEAAGVNEQGRACAHASTLLLW